MVGQLLEEIFCAASLNKPVTCFYCQKGVIVVPILDGNSEPVANEEIFQVFSMKKVKCATAADLIKCLKQVKY